ncbi:MAG: hypothetical protein H0W50_02310 [Parachlamydiaceae bacterium]|nr:hypothetical protein [Parachlamydiaceae bacterium]
MSFNITNRDIIQQRPAFAVLGQDALRPPIKAELKEVQQALQNFRSINEHPSVELISKWHEQFVEAITAKDYPDLRIVKKEFIEMLITIVVPVELFVNQPVPIIQLMSEKLKDPNSIFYSKPFADNADKVIAETKKVVEIHEKVPENLLKQLRDSEAKRAKELEKESAQKAKMEQLREKVRNLKEKKNTLDDKMDNVSQKVLQKVEEVKEKVKAQDHEFAEKSAAILKKVDDLKNAAEEMRDAIPLLNKEIALTGQQIEQLKNATVQLQKNVEQTKKDIENSNGGWLSQVLCIVASVVVSVILEVPVLITPSGVAVG